MELRLINDNKLKIMLTNEDMASLDITCEEIDYDDTGTRRMFWDILDRAKHETGFDAAGDKIFVQVYPDKSGGCLMYVTKMNGMKNERDFPTLPEPQKKSAAQSCAAAPAKLDTEVKPGYGGYEKKYKSKLYTAAKKKRALYGFYDSEYLHLACKILNSSGFTGKSDIFYDKNTYFLSLEDTKESAIDKIGEFGFLINNPYFGFYLWEYTQKLLSGDAVNIFCEAYGEK